MPDKPVFIGGFRSGTTLLINLLGLHSQVAPWFETKDLTEALRWMRVLRRPRQAAFEADYCLPQQPAGFEPDCVAARMRGAMAASFARLAGREGSGKAPHELYPIGHDCLGYSLDEGRQALDRWCQALGYQPDFARAGEATGGLIRELGERHRQALERPVWINKTPEIPRFAPELRAALGPCRIIYLVRNGLDVVNSAARLGWGEVEVLAFNWKGLLELTREAMAGHAGDYLEIRYEDLLTRPAETLGRVLAFSGLPAEEETILARYGRLEGGAFDRSRIGASRLSREERAAFERVAGELQSRLGY